MKEQRTMEKSYKNLLNNFYDDFITFLNSSLSMNFWKGGPYTNQRVKCTIDKNQLKELQEIDKKGIYIFGCDDCRLLYVGKTKQSFLSRLSGRYLFGKKSQYKLATEYQKTLSEESGIKSVETLRDEFEISRVRAIGVKKFGEVEIDNIWFIIIPIEDESIISSLELAMINVGNKWNKNRGFKPLINIDK